MLQHEHMLVVRKEGKAHDQYNSFRSAFELLEAVGREPQDSFEEICGDLPPLQKLEQRFQSLQHQMDDVLHKLEKQNTDLLSRVEQLEKTANV
ncbi:MAG: hypothetical protein GY813_02440 [Halieaceae bacterium]|nr:hypothetical protein [Halieaceae bacterium]